MSEVHTGGCASDATRRERGDAAPLGAADWLALLTAAHGGDPADILCSAAHEGFPAGRNDPDVRPYGHLPLGTLAEANFQANEATTGSGTNEEQAAPTRH